jgi:hypothetical protein
MNRPRQSKPRRFDSEDIRALLPALRWLNLQAFDMARLLVNNVRTGLGFDVGGGASPGVRLAPSCTHNTQPRAITSAIRAP